MKILVITNLFPPHLGGGSDLRCQNTVTALKQRGHEVKVLTSNYGLKTEQRDNDIERRLILHGILGEPKYAAYFDLRRLEMQNHSMVRETISEFKPDLIYIWSLSGLGKSLVFTFRHIRLPTVYDVSDDWIAAEIAADPWVRWWNSERVPLTNAIMRRALELTKGRARLDGLAPTRMALGYDRIPGLFGSSDEVWRIEPNSIAAFQFDRLYFTSEFLKNKTEQAGFQVRHGEVIYPAIAMDQFFGEVKGQAVPVKKLLVLGRLDERSGVLTALKAMQMARQNNAHTTMSVSGRGESDYIAQLRSEVINKQLPVDFVSWPASRKEAAALCRAHDAFLHTSEWDEPFLTAPLEAMACGVPVIGARSGAANELLRHGENALTYTPGDSIELGSRIQELQMQPALRCQMAETAQTEVSSRFNEAVIMDQIENYLNASLEVWQNF